MVPASAPGHPSKKGNALGTWRISTLQWAIGTFCAIIGALMLLAPHQYSGSSYTVLQGWLPGWGSLFMLAGGLLIAVALLNPRRQWTILAHILAAGVLLVLAYGFLVLSLWTGAVVYTVLGLGTLLVLMLPDQHAHPADGRDFFVLLLGVTALLNGALFVVVPDQFNAPVYAGIRPHLTWLGAAYMLAGCSLAVVQIHPRPHRVIFCLAHLLCAGVFLVFCLRASLPHLL